MTYHTNIVIIGAGIVGLSTAYALLEQGLRDVLVLEQETVNHERCTSASISRLLRFDYGADLFYSCMVKRSLALWQMLERKTQKRLYTSTGVLTMGEENDEVKAAHEIACQLGLGSEYLSVHTARQRFPQFAFQKHDIASYNPSGGILHASAILQALQGSILDRGGRIVEKARVREIVHDRQDLPICLKLQSGEEILANRVVVAIGPWVQNLLHHLDLPVHVTRQYLLYFSGLDTHMFGTATLPAFIARQNLYGFPIHAGSNGWLKVASHAFGRPIDPDGPGYPEDEAIEQMLREARQLIPALRSASVARVESCMYDVSPDEDFILDYVPGDARLVFASGLSGHGFKFGLLLGRLLSSLLCETLPDIPLTRFSAARFSHPHAFVA